MNFVLFVIFAVLAAIGGFRVFQTKRAIHGVPFFAASLVFLFIFLSFVTVDAGYRGVVLRFGAVTGRTLEPGGHFILPVFETVEPINVQVQIVKPDEQAASHDLQVVHAQITLGYRVDPADAGYIYATLNNDAQNRVIVPAILEAIKAVMARYDAEQLISERTAVRDGIEAFVTQRLTPHHIIVDAVSITNLDFSQQFNEAIEEKVTAAQRVLTSQNNLQRIKIEAEQKVAAAEGEAKALEVQKAQVTPELIQLRTIEMMNAKWDGQLPSVVIGSGGGVMPLLDVLKNVKQK